MEERGGDLMHALDRDALAPLDRERMVGRFELDARPQPMAAENEPAFRG
jgi:hypothetical protein